MSDTAETTVVQTEAPAAPAPEAPQAEAQQSPPATMSRVEAKAALRTPLVEAKAPVQPEGPDAAPAAKEDAAGRLHGEDGKFVAKPKEGEVANSAETTAEPGDGPAAEGDTAETKPEGGEPPAGFVRVELPTDHPLRDQGHEYVLAPEGQEDIYRSLAKSPVKRRELESARESVTKAEEQADRYEAALRASQEFTNLLFTDRRIMETFWQVQEENGEEHARRWLAGLAAEQGQNLNKYVEESQRKRQEARVRQQASEFLDQALDQGRKLYPHWSDQEYRQALAAYASFASVTGANELTLDAFREHADPAYVRNPKVRQFIEERRLQRQREQEERVRAQGAERERAALERTREKVQANPLSGLPAGGGTGHEPPPAAAKPVSYADARRAAFGRG